MINEYQMNEFLEQLGDRLKSPYHLIFHKNSWLLTHDNKIIAEFEIDRGKPVCGKNEKEKFELKPLNTQTQKYCGTCEKGTLNECNHDYTDCKSENYKYWIPIKTENEKK